MGPHCLQKSTLNLGKETKISTRGRIKSYARLEGIFRPHSFGLKRLSQRGKLRGEVSIRAIAESSPEMVKSFPSMKADPLNIPTGTELKAVLFDVDGTLADSDPLHFMAFKEVLQEVGFNEGKPITMEFFQKKISGRHNPDIGADFFPDWPVEKRDNFLDYKEERFRQLAHGSLKEVSGLFLFCDWLKDRGIRRVAVTNAPRKNAEQMIAALGLNSFFEHLIIGSECPRAKPFPDPYLAGLTFLGIAPENAFAVEDSPSGIKAARAAGLAVFGVLSGHDSEKLIEAGATLTISDFNDKALWQALE